jgi:hypothetical protein
MYVEQCANTAVFVVVVRTAGIVSGAQTRVDAQLFADA